MCDILQLLYCQVVSGTTKWPFRFSSQAATCYYQSNHTKRRMHLVKWLAQGHNKRTVCVCSTRLLPRDGSLYFKIENRRDILNITLLIRITAQNQSLTMGSKHKNITFNYLKRCKWVDNNPNKIVQLFVVKIVLCLVIPIP